MSRAAFRRWAGPSAVSLFVLVAIASILAVAPGGSSLDGGYAPGAARVQPERAPAVNVGIAAQNVAGEVGASRWDPPVIFNDGVETSTFTVPISGGDFDSVWVSASGVLVPDTDIPEDVGLFTEIADDLLRIYDDGTHGDATPGDGVYTRSDIVADGALSHDGGTHQRLDALIYFFRSDADGFVRTSSLALDSGLGVVDAGQRGVVDVVELDTDLTATTHALFLVDDGTIYPDYPNVDADGVVDVCEACGVLIGQFGDEFDFIVLQNREVLNEVPDCGCQAFFKGTKNDVEGIGVPLRDINVGPDTFADGTPFNTFSDGTLRGIIWSNRLDGSALSHEVMHRWAVDAAPQLNWLDGEGHYLEFTTVNGLMDLELLDASGFLIDLPEAPGIPVDFVPNGDGTFRMVSRPGEFNATFDPFSLYLAGFIPASQVPPVFVLEGAVDLSDPNRVTADGVREITIDDVIAIEGARVPSVAASPKDFRIGTIVISDRPYTEAEYAFVTLALRYWESDSQYDGSGSPPWRAATNGISSITVSLPGLVIPGDPIAVTVEAGQTLLGLGQETTVSATVIDDAGVAVPGVSVQFREELASAALADETAETGADGVASTTFTADAVGEVTVTVTVVQIDAGQTVETGIAGSVLLTVQEEPVILNRTQTLLPGWNLVGWGGPETHVTDATATIVGSLGGFFTWDAAAGSFLTFNPALPPALNTLTQVPSGAGVWTFIGAGGPVPWDQPAFNGERAVTLVNGFNLVMWTGPDDTPITEAITGLGALNALFIWDAAAQTFQVYNPSLPPALNTATEIDHGAGVWVLMNAAGVWDQPAR